MVESQFEHTDPTPNSSPKYQGGEKMPDEACFVPTKSSPAFSVVATSNIKIIIEQKFVLVNRIWFEFSNLRGMILQYGTLHESAPYYESDLQAHACMSAFCEFTENIQQLKLPRLVVSGNHNRSARHMHAVAQISL